MTPIFSNSKKWAHREFSLKSRPTCHLLHSIFQTMINLWKFGGRFEVFLLHKCSKMIALWGQIWSALAVKHIPFQRSRLENNNYRHQTHKHIRNSMNDKRYMKCEERCALDLHHSFNSTIQCDLRENKLIFLLSAIVSVCVLFFPNGHIPSIYLSFSLYLFVNL